MKGLRLGEPGQRLCVLCLGAHSDDIEIGAGATLLHWSAAGARLDVTWCVLSAVGPREAEARASAEDFLHGIDSARTEVHGFRDGFFPAQSAEIKTWFEGLKGRVRPDVILTHKSDDAHQDHREVSALTWNTFRDHLILEYEIPKWDGDLGRPNLYVPVSAAAMARKADLLMRHFGSQRSKHWFDEETFRGLARLRGLECNAPERYAEAFVSRKIMIG
jgi:LmbE family N-acetylglucosaminyl deacetylase